MSPPNRLAAALADRYTILREIGQGGMATAYLAHDLRHDRKVAIKVLKILLHDGRPMVMDFGIALAVSAAAGA